MRASMQKTRRGLRWRGELRVGDSVSFKGGKPRPDFDMTPHSSVCAE